MSCESVGDELNNNGVKKDSSSRDVGTKKYEDYNQNCITKSAQIPHRSLSEKTLDKLSLFRRLTEESDISMDVVNDLPDAASPRKTGVLDPPPNKNDDLSPPSNRTGDYLPSYLEDELNDGNISDDGSDGGNVSEDENISEDENVSEDEMEDIQSVVDDLKSLDNKTAKLDQRKTGGPTA